MNETFFLGQLRVALVAFLAYAGGKGWLTPQDSTLAVAIITSMGPVLGPWIWSIYVNLDKKLVPHDSIAVSADDIAGAAVPGTTVMAKQPLVKVVGALLIGFLIFMPHDGFAQTPLPKLRPPTGNIANDFFGVNATDKSAAALDSIATVLAKPFQDIANFIGDDADGAVKLSTAIPNIQDGHGQQCWIAMQSFGAIVKAHPIPITFHVINDYESLRLLGIATNNLCSNVHCTQVFADFTAMAQAASPMPLAIPSLHDLCIKVPQIAVVPPVSVATDAAPKTTP